MGTAPIKTDLRFTRFRAINNKTALALFHSEFCFHCIHGENKYCWFNIIVSSFFKAQFLKLFIVMRPLITNQRVLTWFHLYPADESTKKWKKWIYASVLPTIAAIILFTLASSAAYFFKFLSTDLIKSMFTIIQIAPSLALLNALPFTFFLRSEILAVFQKLSIIYDTSEQFINISVQFSFYKLIPLKFHSIQTQIRIRFVFWLK